MRPSLCVFLLSIAAFGQSGGGLLGTYFGNTDLTNPLTTRVDATVNFNWGTGAPHPQVPAGVYSVRWTGQVQANFSQTYTFYTVSNDGVRLWVNNQMLINNWTNHAATENSGSITLQAGQWYPIVLEYYQAGGTAQISLSYQSPSTPKQIIPSNALSSAPASVSVSVSPSASTRGPSQTQQFTANVSGTTNTVVSWSVSPTVGTISSSGLYTAPSTITTQQTVTVTATSQADPSKSGTATVTLMPPATGGTAGLVGQYFGDKTLSNPLATRVDPTINFNWGTGPPHPQVPAGMYSVRWTGQVRANFSQTYTFYTVSNDGVRLWVNNQMLINNWSDHAATENAGSIALQAGQWYPITIEYYQSGGTAQISLSYASPSTPKQIIPSGELSSNPPQAPIAVSVSPTVSTRGPSQTQQFTATVTGTSNTAVAWSLSPSIGTISTNGLYTAPASITTQQAVTVIARSQANSSASGTATVTLAPPPASGTAGLVGQYFGGKDLTNPLATRVDPTVNFNWGTGAPHPQVPAGMYSVRWTGQVRANFSQTYTFYTVSNDGVRLWVNNQLLINNWTDHVATENSGSLTLQAGQWYPIVLEFYQSGGTAQISLSYASPSTPKQIIPSSDLDANGGGTSPNAPPQVSLTAPSPGSSYLAPVTISMTATATDTDGSVTRVDFLRDGTVACTDTASPYACSWTAPAGTYSLVARAYDNAGAVGSSSPASVTVRGIRIMPLGDSITHGVDFPGAYRIGLWSRLTGNGSSVDFRGSLANGPDTLPDQDHQGQRGWRIDQIHANVDSWIAAQKPQVILLHIGTNDMLQSYALSTAPDRLSALIDRITLAAPNAYVIVASIIPIGDTRNVRVVNFNAAIPGIVDAKRAAGKRVSHVNMYNAVPAADLYDGIHPNAQGLDKMAAAWFQALTPILPMLTPE